jgi:peptidoglycan hydrolase-like protein with peptidoglycan-binding domain
VRVRAGRRTIGLGLGVVVALALGAWMAGREIRSSAQVAAETAPPVPSAITAPVERRVLSSEVIVRGTVRYGSPQPVVLASSEAKQSSGDADIVTTRPRPGTRVDEGAAVMSVSGRPVFVLRGAQPSHRDLGPGTRGPDVAQLETALDRMGFAPGPVDGRYDGQTGAAVAAWYESVGWEPFGPTDLQVESLRAANAAAAAARDLYLQSLLAVKAAVHGALPGEIAQARVDAEAAQEAVDTADLKLRTARIKLAAAQREARGNTAVTLALRNQERDNELATAELGRAQATLNRAYDALAQAQSDLAAAPPDSAPSERLALEAAVRAANDDVAVARLDVRAAERSVAATRAAGRDAVAQARAARRVAADGAKTAAAQLVRAQRSLETKRRLAKLVSLRVHVLLAPGEASIQRRLAQSAATEAHGTAAEAGRLARKMGVQVPANEVLFFPSLPLRVDSVRVRRGDSASGHVMTVSNSRLAVDSSLSLTDAKLVRAGATVRIEEPDLGVKTTGTVTQVADRPGTHKVDPSRVYLEVAPGSAPAKLVGASVKLTIAVESTEGEVLAVPVTALSVGADGSSRVRLQRAGGDTQFVRVEPGLAAQGLVEVRPASGELDPGNLVIVGARGAPTGQGKARSP